MFLKKLLSKQMTKSWDLQGINILSQKNFNIDVDNRFTVLCVPGLSRVPEI